LELVITAGEETGCQGAFHLAQKSGALGRAGAVVVGEPTSNYPLVGHKGAFWLNARTRGVTAHGRCRKKASNAVFKAARAVAILEKFRFSNPPHPLMGQATPQCRHHPRRAQYQFGARRSGNRRRHPHRFPTSGTRS